MVEPKAKRVTPDQLISNPDLWEFVKLGLLNIKSRVGSRSDWQPLHIRKSIETGGSELWVGYENDVPVGFYILSINYSVFTNVPQCLWIWLVYTRPGVDDLLVKHLPDIEYRARQLGITRIEMMSPRKGWLRVGPKLGLEPVETIYAKELD